MNRLTGEYQSRYLADMALVSKKKCDLTLRDYTCLTNYEFYMTKID